MIRKLLLPLSSTPAGEAALLTALSIAGSWHAHVSVLHVRTDASRESAVRAVFDRSFIDEQGIRWVIDYKTSQHIGGGLEEFLDREVERYRAQLQRYGMLAKRMGPEPVRLGLYFPLMQAWREWAA